MNYFIKFYEVSFSALHKTFLKITSENYKSTLLCVSSERLHKILEGYKNETFFPKTFWEKLNSKIKFFPKSFGKKSFIFISFENFVKSFRRDTKQRAFVVFRSNFQKGFMKSTETYFISAFTNTSQFQK